MNLVVFLRRRLARAGAGWGRVEAQVSFRVGTGSVGGRVRGGLEVGANRQWSWLKVSAGEGRSWSGVTATRGIPFSRWKLLIRVGPVWSCVRGDGGRGRRRPGGNSSEQGREGWFGLRVGAAPLR